MKYQPNKLKELLSNADQFDEELTNKEKANRYDLIRAVLREESFVFFEFFKKGENDYWNLADPATDELASLYFDLFEKLVEITRTDLAPSGILFSKNSKFWDLLSSEIFKDNYKQVLKKQKLHTHTDQWHNEFLMDFRRANMVLALSPKDVAGHSANVVKANKTLYSSIHGDDPERRAYFLEAIRKTVIEVCLSQILDYSEPKGIREKKGIKKLPTIKQVYNEYFANSLGPFFSPFRDFDHFKDSVNEELKKEYR